MRLIALKQPNINPEVQEVVVKGMMVDISQEEKTTDIIPINLITMRVETMLGITTIMNIISAIQVTLVSLLEPVPLEKYVIDV